MMDYSKDTCSQEDQAHSLIVQRLIKYCLKHRYAVNITRKKALQNRTQQQWVYNVVILITDFPKYSRAAPLLYMPLIRPRDEKEKVIKKETNQRKACCYNKLFKGSRASGLWRQYKTESMPPRNPKPSAPLWISYQSVWPVLEALLSHQPPHPIQPLPFTFCQFFSESLTFVFLL